MRSFLPLLLIVAVIGWFLPEMMTGMSSSTAVAEDPGQPQSQVDLAYESAEDDWLATDIVLKRQSDGHFYATVAVNGQDIEFLIDTGATIVALNAADAQQLGYYVPDDELQLVGRGASGNVYGQNLKIDTMQLGSLTANSVPAAIVPSGLDKSLLGQAFLKQIATVEISGDVMTLK